MTRSNPGVSAAVDDELDVFTCPLDGIRLIEASAGTGKTWAISGLVLRLLLERGLPVQQVLVVTFTEAATAELRERIRSRLAEVLAAVQPGATESTDALVAGLLARLRSRPDHDDDALARRLDLALHDFDEAAIFTIHGFCQRALADAPFSARLPMGMEVLQDDAELRDEALKDAWRAEVSTAPLPPALATLLLQRGDTPQRWSLLLKRMLGRPLASRWWPAMLEDRGKLPKVDVGPLAAAFGHAATHWQAERGAILALLTQSLTQLKGNVYRADGVVRGAAAWDAYFNGREALAPLGDDEAKALLFTRTRLVDNTKAKCLTPSHAFFDEADALFGLRAEATQAVALARAWLLRRVLERAETALRKHKRELGLVAFDDMLFNLYEGLHDSTDPARAQGLAATLRARYPAALIDEFQDTDPLQFAIFRKLYGPASATTSSDPGPRPTLFLVGDPKQAIYSFRNADLPTYLQARALADAQYSLAHNQRSTPALVEALNRLFGQHPRAFMQPGLDYRPVQVGAKPRALLVDHSLLDWPARHAGLQLWRIPEDERDGQPPLRAQAHALSLQATAAEITRLLNEAGLGRITLDGRPLRAGDIAVLVRSHGQGAEVRRALAARGVGSVELSQASVYHSPEAEDLARVLTAVLHPTRERLLRAALATELFGRNAQALEAAARDEAGLLPELLRFGAYRDTWQQRGIGVMLRQMMTVEGLAARLLQLPQGERRLTNWLHLAEALHQAETTHHAPPALLRWFEVQRSDEAVTDASQQRLESDQNLVQIVTIHKSKGLEYPFVFCPFLWVGQHPAGATAELLAYHEEAAAEALVEASLDPPTADAPGMRLDFRAGLDPAFDAAAVRQRLALDDAAETLRLVYVALTRASQRCMLVVGCSATATRGGKTANRGSHSLLNWLVAGSASTPAEWLAAKPPQTAWEEVNAAWEALAEVPTADTAETPPISLTPLPDIVADAQGLANAGTGAEAPALQSLVPPAHLPAGWTIASYSLLSRGSATDGVRAGVDEASDQVAADHDGPAALVAATEVESDQAWDELVETPAAHRWAADDILRFPRGAAAGDCIHGVFERVDFTEPAGWPAVVHAALPGLPDTDAASRPALAAMLLRMLRDVCATPLAPGLRLGELHRSRRLDELEFHLDAPALSAERMNHKLDLLGYAVPPLTFGRLQGYLRGFIDLVFEHDGRTYLLDWKSNHLGRSASDFTPLACARAMADHGYHLQSLTYSVALERLLRLRRPDYDFERHFGGVYYLFVRGVRPGWTDGEGRPCGVHFHRPSAAVLRQFAATLAGGETTAFERSTVNTQ